MPFCISLLQILSTKFIVEPTANKDNLYVDCKNKIDFDII